MPHIPSRPGPSTSPGGTAVNDLCRCVKDLFKTYNNEGDTMNWEARSRHMHGCTETAASLVCCTNIRLGQFGEVGEMLNELGSRGKGRGAIDNQIQLITPRFIFPGQQLQGLFAPGRGLHDILENRNLDQQSETVKRLGFIDEIPVPLRRLKNLMTSQLW